MEGQVRLIRRSGSRTATVVALAMAAVVSTAPAGAQTDEWFARDKAVHFGASAVIAAGSYVVATAFFDCRRGRIAVGGATALAAGVGKELVDRAGNGSASWRDLAWDVLGTVTGVAITALVDGPASCANGGSGAGALARGAESPMASTRVLSPAWSVGIHGGATRRYVGLTTSARPHPPYASRWFATSIRPQPLGPSSRGRSWDARP